MSKPRFFTQKTERRLIFSLLAGCLGVLLFGGAYWASLLLINYHPAFIPNSEKRTAMFRSMLRNRRQGGPWIPQQGGFWIF